MPLARRYEYAMRNWQEQSFRDLKSGGWNWAQSYMRCPQGVTRFSCHSGCFLYARMISLGSHAVELDFARPTIHDKT